MTEQQAENARKFFEMLASKGITTAILLSPPEGGSPIATIERNGAVTTHDKRDGKRKKVKIT